MDLSDSIIPKSDQLNADDLIAGPQTFTVREVKKGAAEQPIDIMLVETDRAYRPSKSMRRVLVSGWGREGDKYGGHQLTLYRNPEITFGRDKVGGIEISHLSHIDGPLTVALTRTRGKRTPHTVAVLVDPVATCTDTDELRAMYRRATTDEARAAITARVAELAAVSA